MPAAWPRMIETLNFDPEISGRERAGVGGPAVYDRDPEPWPTYTPRDDRFF